MAAHRIGLKKVYKSSALQKFLKFLAQHTQQSTEVTPNISVLTYALMTVFMPYKQLYLYEQIAFIRSNCFIMNPLLFQTKLIIDKLCLKQCWNVWRDLCRLPAVLTVKNLCLQLIPNIAGIPEELWCCFKTQAKPWSAITFIPTWAKVAMFLSYFSI